MDKKILTYSIFFFNDTATTEIYTLSLHDALPISRERLRRRIPLSLPSGRKISLSPGGQNEKVRSEEHTSELQSRQYLVCRLLLEKKKKSRPCSGPRIGQPTQTAGFKCRRDHRGVL